MSKTKLQKFAQLPSFDNVAQYDLEKDLQKLKVFLKNDKPLILELACGYGEYTVAMAEAVPEKKFIGIDIQGERLYKGAGLAIEKKLDNVLFLRVNIENLAEYLPKKSVAEIWITFPDPYPKKKHAKRRLAGQHFLKIYQQVLQNKGVIHLKTDDPDLFEFSVENVRQFGAIIKFQNADIYSQDLNIPFLYQQTRFEKKHLKSGKKIHYLQFTFPNS